jgi:hypothetical protein
VRPYRSAVLAAHHLGVFAGGGAGESGFLQKAGSPAFIHSLSFSATDAVPVRRRILRALFHKLADRLVNGVKILEKHYRWQRLQRRTAEMERSRSEMTRIVVISIALSIAASGCGLRTIAGYMDYRDCLKKCEKYSHEDSLKQKCEANCLSEFDWSDSPIAEKKPSPNTRR